MDKFATVEDFGGLMANWITKNVVFEKEDYRLVKKVVDERGLGQRGFSAALRQIIREWDETQRGKTEAVEDIASDAFNYSE